jgi:hypothetical protein
MIDDGAEVIEKRSPISPPTEVVVGEWSIVASLASEKFEQPQCWGEDHRAVAPPAQPPVAPEDADLEIVGQSRSSSTGGSHRPIVPAARALRLPDLGDAEPCARVVLPPRSGRAGVGVLDQVEFKWRSRSGERLVKFEDAVIRIEVVPDEKRAHALSIGTFALDVA